MTMWIMLGVGMGIIILAYLYIQSVKNEATEKERNHALGKSFETARKANEARNNPDVDDLDRVYNRDN